MNIYRNLTILLFFILGTSCSSNATGFTLGDKELWAGICGGEYKNYSSEEAKTICHTALMFYWAGYSHAQDKAGLDKSLCPKTLESSITEEYLTFLKNTEHDKNTDFIILANDFFKSMGECS